MINSMTGFGRGAAQGAGIAATVELRSVNSRYCEANVRLPREMMAYETTVQNQIKQRFARGRFNVQVQVERTDDAALPIAVNPSMARAYGRLLTALRDAAGIEAPVTVEQLLKYPDVLTTVEESPEALAASWAIVVAALDEAMNKLEHMRQQEGQALAADLSERIDAIDAQLAIVKEKAPLRVDALRERLHERLQEIFDDGRIDPERLEVEIVVYADKVDVSEECVRLHSHLHLFREALASDEPVGRKLNFIAQEMNREINTIGSKANDADLARHVVEMKDTLEKIREQVENVE